MAQQKVDFPRMIDNAYAELQNDLIDLDKTLVRRRGQQATLEERLRALSGRLGYGFGRPS